MIDYAKAYDDIKSTPFANSNTSFDLREPYGWMPNLAQRHQRQDLMLIRNLRFAYIFGWNKEEILEIIDIPERVYNNLILNIDVILSYNSNTI